MQSKWSRREMLRRGVVLGGIATLPASVLAQAARNEPYANFTATQAATLEAVVARLIPSDANGPGALEAGAARYIDGALGDALAGWRAAYAKGLAALEAYARSAAGKSFAALDTERQDALLTELEQNRAPGFNGGSAAFFELVLGHTLEGMFGDPHYGGNQRYIGWDLVSYPGLRLAVTAEQQRMNAALEPTHTGAYDGTMFDAHSSTGGRHDD
jgi:gluconate 2-dehydrogenase gamma chain